MSKLQNHYVMDYETLSNCFTAVFIHYKTDQRHIFIVHESQNDINPFIDFLIQNRENSEWHISFNGLAFDAQVTHHVLTNEEDFRNMTGDKAARAIYGVAQDTIERANNREFFDYYEKSMSIKQIDVYKLNHWNNRAKQSSLKWIQYSMDWFNMQDMPIHHANEITKEQIPEIIEYNINDVLSTKAVFETSKDQIKLRQTLTEEYGINLFNASEPKISKELFMDFLSKKLNISKYDLKDLRTYRSEIVMKDLILDYIDFKTDTFKGLHESYSNLIVRPPNTKGVFEYNLLYKGVKTTFGLGGIHGAKTGGIYESTEDTIIMSSDVTSYYPNLAIRNKWAPKQINKEAFCELYEWFFDERVKIPKSDPRNYVYKIILNSTYGLSNDQYSFLYDPQFTMQITINGQLSLAMLYEMISEGIPGCTPLMQNTDGVETIIPRKYVSKYLEICEEWEKITNLNLEHDTYQKLILSDVNNYIAVHDYKEISEKKTKDIQNNELYPLLKTENGKYFHAKTKCKGRFEFQNLALHKNKSFLVVRKAIYNYFIHNKLPEAYLEENKIIMDYCGGIKARNPWNFYTYKIDKGEFKKKKVQKVVRYFISQKGCKIVKHNGTDNRDIQSESGKWLQTIFNKIEKKEFEDYFINNLFYKDKIYKEINNVIDDFKPKQYQLF